MRGCAPHRQRCGSSARIIVARSGCESRRNKPSAAPIIPRIQYPHWIALPCKSASCIGDCICSIVSIVRPTKSPMALLQVSVGSPSKRTAHEPHCSKPQPSFTLLISNTFRRTKMAGTSSVVSTSVIDPLISRLITASLRLHALQTILSFLTVQIPRAQDLLLEVVPKQCALPLLPSWCLSVRVQKRMPAHHLHKLPRRPNFGHP